jgi:hypothetical protein
MVSVPEKDILAGEVAPGGTKTQDLASERVYRSHLPLVNGGLRSARLPGLSPETATVVPIANFRTNILEDWGLIATGAGFSDQTPMFVCGVPGMT